MQDLQRLLKKASDAGLVDGNLAVKKAGGKSVNIPQASSSGAMTDASKRRMVEHEIQDDDWSPVDPLESMPVLPADPAIEDDLKKKNFIPKDVWASIYSDIDDSVAVPEDEMFISGDVSALIWTSMLLSRLALRKLWQWQSQVILT